MREAARALGVHATLMPIKGAWFCARGLHHPAERPMRDADALLSGMRCVDALPRLVAAGFELADVPRTFGSVAVRLRDTPTAWLDLHERPLLVGMGRLSTEAVLRDAERDDDAFGARVALPSLVHAGVQGVGNVLKDRIVHAHPWAARDLARLLDTAPTYPTLLAGALEEAGLAFAAAMVAEHAAALEPSGRWEDFHRALAARGVDVDGARRSLRRVLALERDHTVLARLYARTRVDHPVDAALGLLAGAAMNVARPARAQLYRRLASA